MNNVFRPDGATLDEQSRPERSTTTGWWRQLRGAANPAPTTSSGPIRLSPPKIARTHTSASRPAPPSCSTAAPMSWPRPRNAGGYDVESDLVAGQTPFGGYPTAIGRTRGSSTGSTTVAIPGTGNPTNHGVDPYVATRGENGWTTSYVGIPADNPFAPRPSPPRSREADAGLDTFASRRRTSARLASPTASTGVPVHLPDGTDRAGHGGSLNPGPAAAPAGYVGKRALRRRQPLRLRLDLAVRAGRQRQRRRLDLRPRPEPETTEVVSKTPRRPTTDRRIGDRRARHLRRRHPSRSSASSSPRLGRQPLLAPLHERRRRRPVDRPHAGLDERGPLRRHDRRRHRGLLHDARTSSLTTPTQRRHLPRRRLRQHAPH